MNTRWEIQAKKGIRLQRNRYGFCEFEFLFFVSFFFFFFIMNVKISSIYSWLYLVFCFIRRFSIDYFIRAIDLPVQSAFLCSLLTLCLTECQNWDDLDESEQQRIIIEFISAIFAILFLYYYWCVCRFFASKRITRLKLIWYGNSSMLA